MSDQLEFPFNDPRRTQFTKQRYFSFIDDTFADMKALIHRKNTDYTGGDVVDDPFANFRQAEDFGVDPLVGLAVRMGDKVQRIKAFCRTGKLAVENEGAADAFKDMIGYSLIALGMLAEKEMSNHELTESAPPESVERIDLRPDIYDEAIDALIESDDFDAAAAKAWMHPFREPGGVLFTYASEDGRADAAAPMCCGCLTQVRRGSDGAQAFHDEICADSRIPKGPEDITVVSLEAFAEWQRKLDNHFPGRRALIIDKAKRDREEHEAAMRNALGEEDE